MFDEEKTRALLDEFVGKYRIFGQNDWHAVVGSRNLIGDRVIEERFPIEYAFVLRVGEGEVLPLITLNLEKLVQAGVTGTFWTFFYPDGERGFSIATSEKDAVKAVMIVKCLYSQKLT